MTLRYQPVRLRAMGDISGVWAPVLTPFDAALEADLPRWIAHCRWLLASGCTGLAVFGTTSEANSLSVDERERMLDGLLQARVDPAALMPGTGCSALPDTVRLTRRAVQAGCAGVLVLPPFYYKNVSEEALFRSYAAVIDRVADDRLRLFLYHIPQYSGVPISLRVIERLRAAYPRLVAGMKDSSGDWNNTRAVLEAGFPDFKVFVGSERFLLANLRLGGAGCITATANVNARAIDRLYRGWRTPEAETLQKGVDQVRGVFETLPTIAALKAALTFMREDPAWLAVRPPLLPLDAAQQAALVAGLTEAGFARPGGPQDEKDHG
jgi:4-hydroxy-tetrahydrodipicolinate synthase